MPLPAELRAARALVYAADLDDPRLSTEDSHHLSRVLRLGRGETVAVSDGSGAYRLFTIARTERGVGLALEPEGEARLTERSGSAVGVGFALVKQDRSEWAVAKLVELGVDRIMLLVCDRSVVRPEGGRRMDRLRLIAREAAMQSRRVWLPAVEPPRPFRDVAAELAGGDGGAAIAELGGPPLRAGTSVVLVGPEGGFSADELACGLTAVGLGDTVLRTETAAVAAAVLLADRR